jgi:hypothetical protein
MRASTTLRSGRGTGTLEPYQPIIWPFDWCDPFDPGDWLVPVKNEDRGAGTYLFEVGAEPIFELGYGGLFHMASIANCQYSDNREAFLDFWSCLHEVVDVLAGSTQPFYRPGEKLHSTVAFPVHV